jgi:hypothetical protein
MEYNFIYTCSTPEFVGVMPVRSELVTIEGDNHYVLRTAIRNLLLTVSDVNIKAIYKQAYSEVSIESIMES